MLIKQNIIKEGQDNPIGIKIGEYDAMIEYTLIENKLEAKDFIKLKVAAGFRERPVEFVKSALRNDLYDVVVLIKDEVVGMGRLVGDGVMYWYLQEIQRERRI